MIIGLGTSGHRVIEHFHGVSFRLPLRRTREYVEIIRCLLRGEPLHHHGRIFELERGFTLRFEPVRKEIPIWLASVTPKSVKQTAEIADGWFPIFIPRPHWKEQLDAFHSAVRTAGRAPEDVTVRNPSPVVLTDHPERARAATAANTAFYIARMGDFYYDHFVRLGYREVADAVREAWASGGAAAGASAIPAELLTELGTAGDLTTCLEGLEAAEEAGFRVHSVSVSESDPHKRRAAFERLAAS